MRSMSRLEEGSQIQGGVTLNQNKDEESLQLDQNSVAGLNPYGEKDLDPPIDFNDNSAVFHIKLSVRNALFEDRII